MKTRSILAGILFLTAAPCFAQWSVEPNTPMITPNNGPVLGGYEQVAEQGSRESRTITVVIIQKIPLGPGEWEGYGRDMVTGKKYYLYHRKGEKTIARFVPE